MSSKEGKKLEPKDFGIIFLMGSAIGTTTLLISELSRVLFKVPLSISPLSLKNLFKTIILNGGTITTIVFIGDALGISEKEIKEDLGFDEDEKDDK